MKYLLLAFALIGCDPKRIRVESMLFEHDVSASYAKEALLIAAKMECNMDDLELGEFQMLSFTVSGGFEGRIRYQCKEKQ